MPKDSNCRFQSTPTDKRINATISRSLSELGLCLIRMLEQLRDLTTQCGQILLDCLPNDFQVHFEVVVHDSVAHSVDDVPRDIGKACREFRVRQACLVRRFAHDLDAPDHRVLGARVPRMLRDPFLPRTRRRDRLQPVCAEGTREPVGRAWTSYRHCFTQHSISKSLGQTLRSEDIDADSEQPLGLELDRSQGHESRAGGRINEQVQVAVVSVIAMKGGTEDTRSQCSMASYDLPQVRAMRP